MDACLSFIMANHGRVKPNDIVYDPFVGTGRDIYIYIFFLLERDKVTACTSPGVVAPGARLMFEVIPKAKGL